MSVIDWNRNSDSGIDLYSPAEAPPAPTDVPDSRISKGYIYDCNPFSPTYGIATRKTDYDIPERVNELCDHNGQRMSRIQWDNGRVMMGHAGGHLPKRKNLTPKLKFVR
jgi:hypothetical protein